MPSTTDLSGSMRNVHISPPGSRTPAEIKNGVIHNPLCTRTPKTMGDMDAAKLPAMFITPDTVPLYSPPTSIGTPHAGLITNSRKNGEAVKPRIAVHAEWAIAAGIRQAPEASIAGAATTRRADLGLPGLWEPGVGRVSPTMPAKRGSDANIPTAFSDK